MKKNSIQILCSICMAALMVACVNEEGDHSANKQQQDNEKVVATFTGYQSDKASTETRTTATHKEGMPAVVFWEPTDRIWVKADNGNFYQSGVAQFPTATKAKARFNLTTGSYTRQAMEVRYTGTTAVNENTVIISNQQTQNTANNFEHLGVSGDCGTGVTFRSGKDNEFILQHKASYLCFLPRCMNVALGPNIRLTQIEVTADRAIAGTYDFSDGSLEGKTPTANSSKTITLTTNNFAMNTTSSDITKNGAYMVIAPGTYDLTVAYTIEDPTTNISTTISKKLGMFMCPEGKIKDITANLTPPSQHFDYIYYMWDAQKPYWWQHENDRPTVDGASNPNYPKNQTLDPQRWYHTSPGYVDADRWNRPGDGFVTATQSCRDCPNVNEALWYMERGDAHRDLNHVYEEGGHLHTIAVVWIKKKAAILRDNADLNEFRFSNRYPVPGKPYLGDRDWRTETYETLGVITGPIAFKKPEKTDDYFMLPLIGTFDDNGKYWLTYYCITCFWTSSSFKTGYDAYSFVVDTYGVSVTTNYYGPYGGVAQPFK